MSDSLVIITFFVVFSLILVGAALALGIFMNWRSEQRLKERRLKAELSTAREYIDQRLDEINQAYANNYGLWADANRLPIEAQPQSNNQVPQLVTQSDDFLSRLGIDRQSVQIKRNQVLLLMPIDKKHDAIMLSMQRACSANLFSAVRRDQDYVQLHLLGRIVQMILESELVICDISTRNPNVLYELGIAHALNKKTVIVSEQSQLEKSPFDVQSNRILLYFGQLDLEVKLKEALKEIRFKIFDRLGPTSHN